MLVVLIVIPIILFASNAFGQYEPSWESLDTRPLPKWYDEAKIGIFLHWGVFSVPSFGSEWFWADWSDKQADFVDFMKDNYRPSFTYQDFAKDFTAEFFNPYTWAKIFAKSGAKYVVLTSKHHEGYALWPSKYSYSWNSMDVGPRMDLVGKLSRAVRSYNLTFGLYHSMYEWFNPIYRSDKSNNFTTRNFPVNKIIPEMKELIETYEPSVLWSDGDWEANDEYWGSTEFLAWLYNESPVRDSIVVNDRWGSGIPCKHGDFYTCTDRFNPGVLQKHKWENAMTVDKHSWGYRRNAQLSDYLTINELIAQLASTVSCGGNMLINVGPTKDGMIAPIFQERLEQLGSWLAINGEAIYGTKPWFVQNDTSTSDVWYTSKGDEVYAIALSWPVDNRLALGSILGNLSVEYVYLLGDEKRQPITWDVEKEVMILHLPDKATVKSDWAYVFQFVPNKNDNISVVTIGQ